MADWYVSAAGAGNKDGTENNAWEAGTNFGNLYDAWGAVGGIVGDDTLYILDEINQMLNIPAGGAGTSGHVITIRGDYPGHPGIINGAGKARAVLTDTASHYLTFINIEIKNSDSSDGMLLQGNYNTCTNVTVHGSDEDGIRITGTNGTIEDCTIYNCGQHDATGGIRIGANGIVRRCTVYNCNQNVTIDARGITVAGADCQIYQNIIHDIGGTGGANIGIGCGIEGWGASGALVHRNIVWNCYNSMEWKYGSNNAYIYNNLFFQAGLDVYAVEIGLYSGVETTGCHFENNTVYGGGGGIELTSSTNTVRNNIFWNIASAYYAIRLQNIEADIGTFSNNILQPNGSGYVARNVDTSTYYTISTWRTATSDSTQEDEDPLFLSTTYGESDFLQLDTSSPAYRAGTDLSGTFAVDYAGTTRTGWDIGAYFIPSTTAAATSEPRKLVFAIMGTRTAETTFGPVSPVSSTLSLADVTGYSVDDEGVFVSESDDTEIEHMGYVTAIDGSDVTFSHVLAATKSASSKIWKAQYFLEFDRYMEFPVKPLGVQQHRQSFVRTVGGVLYCQERGTSFRTFELNFHDLSEANFLELQDWYENANKADGGLNSFYFFTHDADVYEVRMTSDLSSFVETTEGYYDGTVILEETT